jgi:hypothetical protein
LISRGSILYYFYYNVVLANHFVEAVSILVVEDCTSGSKAPLEYGMKDRLKKGLHNSILLKNYS